MEKIKKWLADNGYGYGDGDGYGDGSGYGYSSGDGYGYGSGSGYGDGSGDGYGYGQKNFLKESIHLHNYQVLISSGLKSGFLLPW